MKATFDRLSNGKLVVNFKKPFFKQELQQYKKVEGKEESTALPKLVMAEKFKDGLTGLQRCIDAPIVNKS